MIQVLGAVVLIIWAILLSFIFFYLLNAAGKLRVELLFEILGLDFIRSEMHGTI